MSLAEALGVSVDWILYGDPAPGSDPGASVVREREPAYEPNPDPHGSPAEQLMAFLGHRVGMRRLVGELTSRDLIAVAYTLAREERFGPEEFAKLDAWRDQILADERKPPRSG